MANDGTGPGRLYFEVDPGWVGWAAEAMGAGEAAWYSLSDGRLHRAAGLQKRGARLRAGEALGAGERVRCDGEGRLWKKN